MQRRRERHVRVPASEPQARLWRRKSSRGELSFTYGRNAEESTPYLKLPPGQALSEDGTNLQLVAAAPYPLR